MSATIGAPTQLRGGCDACLDWEPAVCREEAGHVSEVVLREMVEKRWNPLAGTGNGDMIASREKARLNTLS
jgi:hypothetical protein